MQEVTSGGCSWQFNDEARLPDRLQEVTRDAFEAAPTPIVAVDGDLARGALVDTLSEQPDRMRGEAARLSGSLRGATSEEPDRMRGEAARLPDRLQEVTSDAFETAPTSIVTVDGDLARGAPVDIL